MALTTIKSTSKVPQAVGWVPLQSTTASNDATVNMETGIDGTYDLYMISVTKLKIQTDAENFQSRLKIGGSYLTLSNYQFHNRADVASSSTPSAAVSTGASAINLFNCGATVASEFQYANVFFCTPAAADNIKGLWWEGWGSNTSTVSFYTSGAGSYDENATSALTGVQFKASSGNITSGEFALYGLQKVGYDTAM